MKIVVGCIKCCRRYDAAGRKPGTRFRCLCGESLTVGTPQGHDASVVRCSSCGAPREANSECCGHCGSDFTLHERDLDSVCPACLARVSNRARYCHHCAAPLFAEHLTKEVSELRCPSCESQRKLVSRRFGDFPISVLECQLCAGLWLGLESLEELFNLEAKRGQNAVGSPEGPGTDRAESRRGYIPCVICGDLMSRRHIAQGKSGVVVDLCGRHGVWFDANELAQLIAWTRTGGLEEVRRDFARLIGYKDQVRKRHVLNQARSGPRPSTRSAGSTSSLDPGTSSDSQWIEIIGGLAIETLFKGLLR